MMENLEKKTTCEGIISNVFQYADENNLKIGDILPAENKLAELLGVGRSSIREALSALKVLGYIDSKPGVGSILCRKFEVNKKENLFGFMERLIPVEKLFEVIEARKTIEAAIAAVAAERATNDDILKLLDLCEQYSAPDLNAETIMILDRSLHTTVAAASHNETMIGIVDYLYCVMDDATMQEYKKKNLRVEHRHEDSSKEHHDIISAICRRDAKDASNAVVKHLDNHKDAIVKQLLISDVRPISDE